MIYFDPWSGQDKHSGSHPHQAKKTLSALNQALRSAPPGTEFKIRNGAVYRGMIEPRVNDISISGYSLGGEDYDAPLITNTGIASRCVDILADRVSLKGLELWNAEIGVATYEQHQQEMFSNLTLHNLGFGINLKSAYSVVENCFSHKGRMVRAEGLPTDAGGVFVVLHKEAGYELNGCIIRGNAIIGALATENGIVDGGDIEIYGGIDECLIENNISMTSKGFIELGGVTARKEVVRNVTVRGNLILHPSGIALYVNSPKEQFYADFYNMIWQDNAIIADDAPKSPFYFNGDHGDLSKKLIMTGNRIVANAPIYASSATKVETITRSSNRYYRSDGGKTIGVTIKNGDSVGPINFINAAGMNYNLVEEITNQTEIVRVVPDMQSLLSIPKHRREIGTEVKVLNIRQKFEPDESGQWRYVRKMTPLMI
jgi:hypothetical protein